MPDFCPTRWRTNVCAVKRFQKTSARRPSSRFRRSRSHNPPAVEPTGAARLLADPIPKPKRRGADELRTTGDRTKRRSRPSCDTTRAHAMHSPNVYSYTTLLNTLLENHRSANPSGRARFGPNLAESGPELADIWQISAVSGPTLVEVWRRGPQPARVSARTPIAEASR